VVLKLIHSTAAAKLRQHIRQLQIIRLLIVNPPDMLSDLYLSKADLIDSMFVFLTHDARYLCENKPASVPESDS